MAKKQYASVSQLIRDIAPTDEFRDEFEARIKSRTVIKRLLAMRAVRGLSQEDVAQRMDCSQSRISKLENGKDADARLGDLQAYADAVGCDLSAWPVPRDMKPTDKVKRHAFAIKKHMDDMAKLAKSDENIAEGVGRFFYSLFVNFTLMIGDSAKNLPRRPDDLPYFDIIQLDGDTDAPSDASRPDCIVERPELCAPAGS